VCVTEREVPDELVTGKRAADALRISRGGGDYRVEYGLFVSETRDPREQEVCAGPIELRRPVPYCYVFGLCENPS
jgi:hypothetical protein